MQIEVSEETVVYKGSILQTFNCILSLNCWEKTNIYHSHNWE